MLRIFLTGVAMGAADVVPGVSGGTVAFISGIYFRLLKAIKSVPAALGVLFKHGFSAAWAHIDGTFLAVLGAGILISILSLARLITWLLAQYPTILWGFFFGLIAASSVYLGMQVRWRWPGIVLFLIGIGTALAVAEMRPAEVEATPVLIFISGAIAICAMILPGISGSFILLMLGMYPIVLDALKSFDLVFIVIFASGCLLGLLSFSHLLSFMIEKYRDPVLGLLTGFLCGSLLMVWPWQHATEWFEKSDGRLVALTTENVMPGAYAQLTQLPPYAIATMGMAIFGVVLVFGFSRLAPSDQG